MVLLGEIRHWARILLTFTRPYLGTARSMSKTFAVATYSGGADSRLWMDWRPALRSRLSWARRVRISLARCSASMRCTRERSGAAVGFGVVLTAAGIAAASLHIREPRSRLTRRIHLHLKLRCRC